MWYQLLSQDADPYKIYNIIHLFWVLNPVTLSLGACIFPNDDIEAKSLEYGGNLMAIRHTYDSVLGENQQLPDPEVRSDVHLCHGLDKQGVYVCHPGLEP